MLVVLELDSMDTSTSEETSSVFAALIESLVDINRAYLRRHPTIPLYKAGILYDEKPTDAWKDIPALFAKKRGSCYDLAAWRIAELREAGFDARIHLVLYKTAERDLFHVQVAVNGKIEDPTKLVSRHGLSIVR